VLLCSGRLHATHGAYLTDLAACVAVVGLGFAAAVGVCNDERVAGHYSSVGLK
jgi:hypothetical protein